VVKRLPYTTAFTMRAAREMHLLFLPSFYAGRSECGRSQLIEESEPSSRIPGGLLPDEIFTVSKERQGDLHGILAGGSTSRGSAPRIGSVDRKLLSLMKKAAVTWSVRCGDGSQEILNRVRKGLHQRRSRRRSAGRMRSGSTPMPTP